MRVKTLTLPMTVAETDIDDWASALGKNDPVALG
jgi:hypothetical protein